MLDMTRRHFFGRSATGIGVAALANVFGKDLRAAVHGGLPGFPHFAPKAKRVIYLFQSGGPSQMELFDYKPRLNDFQGQDLPESIRNGQRLTGMSATQSSFPIVPSKFTFAQHGQSGAWVSELMPHTAKIADQLTFIKSMHTEAINHDPAVTFLQTGSQIAGRPSIGAWLSYGIGSETEDLPSFVVMISPGAGGGGQPLYDRLWGSGFLPSRYQGVKFRSVGDPVLFLSNPKGFTSDDRRQFLFGLAVVHVPEQIGLVMKRRIEGVGRRLPRAERKRILRRTHCHRELRDKLVRLVEHLQHALGLSTTTRSPAG